MQRDSFVFAITILLAACVFAVPSVSSQSQEKTIAWQKVSVLNARNSPHVTDQIDEIEIEDIVVEGRSIVMGEPFSASEDWLKNIAFRVKNISGKPLMGVQITLVLPEMADGSPQIPFTKGLEKQKLISPGAEVELTIPAGDLYEWARKIISAKGSLSRISQAEIYVVIVDMGGRGTWSSGCAKTADARNACPRRTP